MYMRLSEGGIQGESKRIREIERDRKSDREG